jgi:hypothetical protein
VAFLIITLIAAAVGFLAGRWAVVLPLAAVLPLYLMGVKAGWWGNGVGDGWQYVLVFGGGLGALGGALGVLARRGVRKAALGRIGRQFLRRPSLRP